VRIVTYARRDSGTLSLRPIRLFSRNATVFNQIALWTLIRKEKSARIDSEMCDLELRLLQT